MEMIELIEKIRNTEGCKVFEACGLPDIDNVEKLPTDVKTFYENCGGICFFVGTPYEFTVVKPNEMVLANPVIVGELCEEDISSKWYIVCKDVEDNYITLDMGEERKGRCYDSFWDRHGVVGECTIVARTFTELLQSLLESKGEELFWLSSDFEYIGDAYDEV